MDTPTPTDTAQPYALLTEWQLWKDRAAFAQTKERALRAAIVFRFFPQPQEGTNKLALDLSSTGVERMCKLVLKYPIDRKVDAAALDALIKVACTKPAAGQAPHALSALNFDLLFRRKPELCVAAYRGLSDAERCALDTCLTVRPGSAQLEVQILDI